MSWDRNVALDDLARARFGKVYDNMEWEDPRARAMRSNVEFALEPLRATAERAYSDGQDAGYEDAEAGAEDKSANPYADERIAGEAGSDD